MSTPYLMHIGKKKTKKKCTIIIMETFVKKVKDSLSKAKDNMLKFKDNSITSIKDGSFGKKIGGIVNSFLLLVAALVMAPMILVEKNDFIINNWEYGTVENDGWQTDSLLLDDSIVKTNEKNKGNVSVYYVQSIGIFVTTQIMISLVKQLELHPDKEVVILITDRVDTETVGELPWEEMAANYPTVRVVQMDKSGTTEDEETPTYSGFEKEIINNLEEGQKFDLYTNTFSYSKNMIKTFADEWKDGFVHMNSMNFFSEGTSEIGTHYVAVEEYLKNNLLHKKIDPEDDTEYDIIDYNNEKWSKLLKGEDVKYDGRKLSHTLGVSPDVDEDGENEFNYFSLTDQYYVYENTGRTNYLYQQSVGFEEVWNTMKPESKTIIEEFYEVGNQEQYIGETNIIYAGNLIDSEADLESQTKIIVDLYDIYDVENNSDINILFKPHPRQDTESCAGGPWLDDFKAAIESEIKLKYPGTITNIDDWYGVVQQETPIEIFAITQHFLDDVSTDTYYKYYITGGSSAVPALYEAGVDKDHVAGYVFSSQGSLNGAINNFGINGDVIPFHDEDKIIKTWETT